tara:strand:+ start:397 stop:663 length:267 start_codon:yes stop_codon:yes gene_type:complete
LYIKNILKKETNINKEKTIICVLLEKIEDRSFIGKKPPEEIIVSAKFNELNVLIFKMFKIIKIEIVNNVYNKKILKVCFNVSDLLKEI